MLLVLLLLVLVLPLVLLAVVFGSITRRTGPPAPFVALARSFFFLLRLASAHGGFLR